VEVRLLGTKPQPKRQVEPGLAASALATSEALDLAVSMLRCFADDVDFKSASDGLMRVRLAKYRWR